MNTRSTARTTRTAGTFPNNGKIVAVGGQAKQMIGRTPGNGLRHEAGWHGPWDWSGAEAAVAGGVGAEGAEEVDLAEGRPVGVAEVELRVNGLPQQESADALFA